MTTKSVVDWHDNKAKAFDNYYTSSALFKERYSVWEEMIAKYCNSSYVALDLGCGSGVFSVVLAKKSKAVVAVDASSSMLQNSRKKAKSLGLKNISFLQANIESLHLILDQKFDIVICSSVLEYVYSLHDVLSTVSCLTKKDGLFLFSMPNSQSIYRKIEPILFKVIRRPQYYGFVNNICTVHDMENKLKKRDFTLLEYRYFASTPIVSGIFRKIQRPQYSDNLFIIVSQLNIASNNF